MQCFGNTAGHEHLAVICWSLFHSVPDVRISDMVISYLFIITKQRVELTLETCTGANCKVIACLLWKDTFAAGPHACRQLTTALSVNTSHNFVCVVCTRLQKLLNPAN